MNLRSKIELILKSFKGFRISVFNNYFKHWADLKYKPLSKKAQLISAQIELTSRCNLSCEMCQHSFDSLQKDDLTLEQFKQILDQLPFLINLTLQGLGEPFLNPDIFLMIKEAKKRNIRVGLTTNATLLTKSKIQEIIDSNLDWMYISLDAVDKSVYENIRRGAIYETTMANIRNFFETKGDKKPDTNFWSLIMEENLPQIPRIIKLAGELGVQKVVLQDIHNWGHQEFSNKIKDLKGEAPDQILKLADEIRNSQSGVRVEINYSSKNLNNQKCDWLWRSVYITCDGFITPCCMQGSDSNLINFGNIFEKPIREILNCEKYQKFRLALKNRPIPDVCLGCPAYYKQEVIKI
jgi:MoaA/NifB/PqqE/SkfB family radical SAM enzyme